jgi:hypothetical protein
MSSDTETAMKLGGAKRKNGHKMNCVCHICENMKNKAKRGGYEEDAEKAALKQMGGPKKKNGHKPNCSCPICKNMRNVKGKTMKAGKSGKKRNGHKMNCGCPICKNMSKKSKKGGGKDDEDDEDGEDDEDAVAPETPASEEQYEDIESIPEATTREIPENESSSNAETETETETETGNGNRLSSMTATQDEIDELGSSFTPNMTGGRRRKTMRKSMKKRGNGHKVNCGCPICKNMRKGKGKTKRR